MKKFDFKKLLSSKKLKYGSMATAFTAIFIAIIVILNIVAALLVEKFPANVDLTENKAFELTEESKNYIKDLPDEVTITVLELESSFAATNTYFKQANEVLKQYAKYSDKIDIRYIDLYKNPTFAAAYTDVDLSNAQILVEAKDSGRKYTLTVEDLFNLQTSEETGSTTIASSKAEEAVTLAVMTVADKDPPVIAILQGHDSVSPSALQDLLKSNGYVIQTASLLFGELDKEIDALLISSPKTDFTNEEIVKLNEFMDNGEKFGKRFFYFASPDQPVLPNLEAFLKEWGITVETGAIYETDTNSYYYYIFNPLFRLVNSDWSGTLNNKTTYMVAPSSRPLRVAFSETTGGRAALSLAEFFDTARAVSKIPEDENWEPADTDAKGPFSSVIMGQKVTYEGQQQLTSRVFAFSSPVIADESVLKSTFFSNGNYIVALFNKSFDRANQVNIVPKNLEGNEMQITQGQVNLFFLIFVVLLPLAVVVFGIVIWLRRRHL